MGSPPTLDHRLDHQEATGPAARAAEAADAAFRQANPDRAGVTNHPDPLTRHYLVRVMEDVEVRGYRVWTQEARENWPTPPEERQAVLLQRAAAAQLTTEQASGPSTGSTASSACPPTTPTRSASRPSGTARPRCRSVPAWPSPPAGRTTATRWCGWPGRTTAPPTPSEQPAPSPSAPANPLSALAPNAKGSAVNYSSV